MRKTDDKVLIAAMRFLAQDIVTEDGVANSAIAEAADRLEELSESLLVAQAANRTSDAAFTRIVECTGLTDVNTLKDLVDYIVHQKTTIDALEQAALKHVSENNVNQWVKIDYTDETTWPDENYPCLVAWGHIPFHSERWALYEFNDVGDDVRLWQNAIQDEVQDWDGKEENPTHWMYAPEYKP